MPGLWSVTTDAWADVFAAVSCTWCRMESTRVFTSADMSSLGSGKRGNTSGPNSTSRFSAASRFSRRGLSNWWTSLRTSTFRVSASAGEAWPTSVAVINSKEPIMAFSPQVRGARLPSLY